MMIHVHQFARGVPIEEPVVGTEQRGGHGPRPAFRKTRPGRCPGHGRRNLVVDATRS